MAGLPKKGTVHRPFQSRYVGGGAFHAPFFKSDSAYQRADNIRPYGIERTRLGVVGAIINRPAVMGLRFHIGFRRNRNT